ncbi:MAG: energy-coupling factor transporter transmembrane protein EcfT [Candidatus Carbobacillus altaicus]|nr:energy-coupling factor transporter transmembrane protein EcfT [Candidatus Carbobacillus altaicus]
MSLIESFPLGRYIPHASFVHDLDPRTKLLSTVAIAVWVFLATTAGMLFFIWIVLGLALFASRISWRYFIKSLYPVIWVLVLLAIVQIVLEQRGETVWTYGVIHITDQGLIGALFLVMRLVALFAASALLTLTTSPLQLARGLESLLAPLKCLGIPIYAFSLMLTIALRFIPTMLDELLLIMKAQMARGADFTSKRLRVRLEALLTLIIPLFVLSFRRADRLALAMEARGYDPSREPTSWRVLTFRWKDRLVLLAIFLITFLYIWIRLDPLRLHLA